METCGLTAEYNPFHKGHARQLRMIRELLGQDAGILVCLSGPFCQRGVPALLDKGVRAGIALREGADLVLELPAAFAASSAERFAQGAVDSLLATGVVRRIAYGTEDPGRHSQIKRAAAILADEPGTLGRVIRDGIASGMGFAAAREAALAQCSGDPSLAGLLRNSNTILAVEYEKALLRSGPLPTLALPLFDKAGTSATLIRGRIWHALSKGPGDFHPLLVYLARILPPPSAAAIMEAVTAGRGLLPEEVMGPALLRSPAFFDREKLEKMEGMQGGLAGRLFKSIRSDPPSASGDDKTPYERLINQLATRAHPATRIRRAILAAALGIEAADRALTSDGPGYIRVLGFNRRGRRLLSFMRKEARLPVIMNASGFRQLKDPSAAKQAALDLQAQALWNYHAGLACHSEFERQILMVR
ncbi:MAG TPA: nucleotidyltransferase family protein [Bacillota bacterium]|jgi:predicted nucleotidyltransferase|nr:nucleotidyltransferase family protein [Fastidiosipila sp.]HPX93824.1 nucleotidyltransferase family protein [Bacillota bacterium]HQB81649.1 nucleotidyltransferase family protein [Bacillota bacterium]